VQSLGSFRYYRPTEPILRQGSCIAGGERAESAIGVMFYDHRPPGDVLLPVNTRTIPTMVDAQKANVEAWVSIISA
jgi:hypothetical protein